MANYYLKCLGIIPWCLRQAQNNSNLLKSYQLRRAGQAVAYLVADPKTGAEAELFTKIVAAAGLEYSELLNSEYQGTELPVLSFGSIGIQNKSLISLPSLSQLMNSVALKREVWGVLKSLVLA